jgi:DNA-directed RNA polymerase subunit M/transcription elongation factor TFIIS
MSFSDTSKVMKKKASSKVVTLPSTQRITCSECGNNKEFLEVSDGVILTTRFVQHKDGSFSQELDDSQVLGQVKFYCGDCGADLTQFHKRFLEMLF